MFKPNPKRALLYIVGDLTTVASTLTLKGEGMVRIGGAVGTYAFGVATSNGFTYGLDLENFADTDLVLTGARAVLGANAVQSLGDTAMLDFANGLNLQDKIFTQNDGTGVVKGNVTAGADSEIIVTGAAAKQLTLGGLSASGSSGFSTSGRIEVGVSGNTLVLGDDSDDVALLGYETTLAGGTLNAAVVELGPNDQLSGYGTVNAAVVSTSTTSGITVDDSGGATDLTVGDAAKANGFDFDGVLTVGGNTIVILDSGFADLGISTTLNGGTITAANGLNIDTGDVVTGSGTLEGPIAGAGRITLSGSMTAGANQANGFDFDGTTEVGSHMLTIVDSDGAELGTTTTIAGGTIDSANGIIVGLNKTLTGYGTLDGPVSGAATLNLTGSLTAGDVGGGDDFAFTGTTAVGANTLTIRDSDGAELGASTTLAGGTVVASGGIILGSGDTVSGNGTLQGAVSGAGDLALTGNMTVGANTASGYDLSGNVSVGTHTLTILDSNGAQLGGSTTLNGTGKIVANGGLVIDTGDAVTGSGTLDAKISGAGTITLEQNLTMGRSAEAAGVNFAGTVDVGNYVLTLRDADVAFLTGTTTLDANGNIVSTGGVSIGSGSDATATLVITGSTTVSAAVATVTGASIQLDVGPKNWTGG